MPAYEMNRTGLVVFILLIAAALWDLYCVVFHGVSSSISNFMVNLGLTSAPVNYVLGCISGHLFFPMVRKGVCSTCSKQMTE